MSGWKINGCFKESLILGLIENGQSLLGHDKNEHVTFKLGPQTESRRPNKQETIRPNITLYDQINEKLINQK